jgi:hypothetical protein
MGSDRRWARWAARDRASTPCGGRGGVRGGGGGRRGAGAAAAQG